MKKSLFIALSGILLASSLSKAMEGEEKQSSIAEIIKLTYTVPLTHYENTLRAANKKEEDIQYCKDELYKQLNKPLSKFYDEGFTKDELKEIVAWTKSPTGLKLMNKSQELVKIGIDAGNTAGLNLIKKGYLP